MRFALVVALTWSMQLSATEAQSESLEHALGLVRTGEFLNAQLALRRAEADPDLTREQLVRLHLYSGGVDQLLDQLAAAEAHYRVALALEPGLVVPSELGEAVRERVERLREDSSARLRLELRAPVTHTGTEDVHIELALAHAPDNFVATVRLSANEWHKTLVAEPTMTADVPPEAWAGAQLSLRASAQTAAGVAVADAEHLVQQDTAQVDNANARRRLRRGLGIGTAAAVVAVAIVVGIAYALRTERFNFGAPGP